MGKKNKSSSLGRALIKDRFGPQNNRKFVANNSMLHTTEIQDGYDWGRLNLQSVTEESSFQEFLSTAELAGTEFQAEKLNIKFVNPRLNVGLLSKKEMQEASEKQNEFREMLKIPRRPAWSQSTSPDELDRNEREHFLEWRRSLAELQEEKGMLLTPYEKNLEFWRQLWRVVERSDVIVQIVDARNPLLFRCEDLEKYVKEVGPEKMNMILINKADFLTEKQRETWAEYFNKIEVKIVFFSAVLAEKEETILEEQGEALQLTELKQSIKDLEEKVEENAASLSQILSNKISLNSSKLLTKQQLIELFKTIHPGKKVADNITTIGLVGYPNVGKSSTINAILSEKKVSVSATPGKTKHFQTLFLDRDLLLCDCPGLVMPSFVFTKAEMILNGILPIDQMRDHVPPTNLVTNLIPRRIMEDLYGILIAKPLEGEDEDRPPTAEELLNSYAYNRGFMTANGQPDNSRAARFVLKDFMNGKLLYCVAPPGVEQSTYHFWAEPEKIVNENRAVPPRQQRAVKSGRITGEDLDQVFFQTGPSGAHCKGRSLIKTGAKSAEQATEKPWKKINKHENKNKKEKLRRVYAHLDQH